jgi:hypothetical protein
MNARTVAPRVMAVLTESELHDFFPDDLLGTLRSLAGDFAVASPDKQGNIDLPNLFDRVNPDVMIGCWHTPTLPAVLPPALRYVCYLAGSVRTLVERQHLERGLVVTNWGSSISRTVAEGALMHILACLRRSSHWAVAMHTRGAWKNESSEAAKREFDVIASQYFGSGHARGVLHLVDSRHPGLDADRLAADWLKRLTIPCVVVATKLDKLTRSERVKNVTELERVHEGPVLGVSVHTGEGLKELWKTIDTLLRR